MCGIFGIFSCSSFVSKNDFFTLALNAQERGSDSSGIICLRNGTYEVSKADLPISI